MLNHMRELRKKLIPVPGHPEELTKIEKIFNKLKPRLESRDAHLRCFLYVKKLQKETAEELYAARFALGWKIREELQDAGILSAQDGENSGVAISSKEMIT